jgi:hypothetical protein
VFTDRGCASNRGSVLSPWLAEILTPWARCRPGGYMVLPPLLVRSFCFSLAVQSNGAAAASLLPRLLSLRGGVQPPPPITAATAASAAVEGSGIKEETGPARLREAMRKPKSKRKLAQKKSRSILDLQDAFTAVVCAAFMGAAAIWSSPLMAVVPQQMSKDVAWMLLGCLFSASLFLLVHAFNRDRALSMDQALGSLLLGPDASSSSLPALGIVSLVGAAAAFQALPSAAG